MLLPEVSAGFWDIASGLVYLNLIPLVVSPFAGARNPNEVVMVVVYLLIVLVVLIPLALELGKRAQKA